MEYAAKHRLNVSFRCRFLYLKLDLTLIILLTAHLSVANAQSPTPCATPQEDCSICQILGDLRLVGGDNFTEGRVEFCYNNTWGTVCDNGFGTEDAMVVCRQLGFSNEGALSVPFATFGQGTGPIVLDSVNCVGNEASLIDCNHDGLGEHSCSHVEDVGVICMIRSIGTVSVSATTQIQGITPTQTASSIDSSIRIPSTSFTFSTSQVVFSDRSIPTSLITAVSPTSGIILATTSSSPSLATSGSSVGIATSLPPQSQPGDDRQSSIATTPPDTGTGQNRSPSSSNTGLIVGLVFLFLILIIVASIVILLVIIFLRKRKEKKIKKNPMAQSASFEGDSIFNLLEETNGTLRPPEQRDSKPDFLVVRHRSPVSTVPNAYNITPGLETKTVPVKKIDLGSEDKFQSSDKTHDDGGTESPPNSLPSTIVINNNERVTYTDITFKSGSPVDTKKPLYDVQEEERDYDSEWSQQSSFESEEEDKEAEGESSKDLTYTEVQFKNS